MNQTTPTFNADWLSEQALPAANPLANTHTLVNSLERSSFYRSIYVDIDCINESPAGSLTRLPIESPAELPVYHARHRARDEENALSCRLVSAYSYLSTIPHASVNAFSKKNRIIYFGERSLTVKVIDVPIKFAPELRIRRLLKKYDGSITVDRVYRYILAEFSTKRHLINTAKIVVKCKNGHTWNTTIWHLRSWCAICKIMQMRCGDPNAKCMQMEYNPSQTNFVITCGQGHNVLQSVNEDETGCRSCKSLTVANQLHNTSGNEILVLDNTSINCGPYKKLRFHCNKLRHNPACQNPNCLRLFNECKGIRTKMIYDSRCRNKVPCNQDFYATMEMIMSEDGNGTFKCDNNHRWLSKREVITTSRMFEIFYDKKFDDNINIKVKNINVTGYNDELKIAFTHGADNLSCECIDNVKAYCAKTNILFIVVPWGVNSISKIGSIMVNNLISFQQIDVKDKKHILHLLKNRILEMDKSHKLYADRCNT